jgi:hypothetical protein
VHYLLIIIHVLMGVSTAGMALAASSLAMKLFPSGEATAYLAVNSVVPATSPPWLLTADFFASHQLTLALTWAGDAKALTLQVRNWTFLLPSSLAFVPFIGFRSLKRVQLRRTVVRSRSNIGE